MKLKFTDIRNGEQYQEPDIIVLRINQGWLNNPRQIKEDFEFMNVRFADVQNDKITKSVFQRLTSSKGSYHSQCMEYKRAGASGPQMLNKRQMEDNMRYLEVLPS
jgi:hypothetical protein